MQISHAEALLRCALCRQCDTPRVIRPFSASQASRLVKSNPSRISVVASGKSNDAVIGCRWPRYPRLTWRIE
jgi:hypothetical protein